MLRNTLIALAAAAAAALALAPAAEAKTNFNIDVGLGFGGGGFYAGAPVYLDSGFYDGGYVDGGCHYEKIKHKKWMSDGSLHVWFSKQLICY